MQAGMQGKRIDGRAFATKAVPSKVRVRSTSGLDATLAFVMGFGALIALLALALLSPVDAEAAAMETATVAGFDVPVLLAGEFVLRACGVVVFVAAAAALLSVSARESRKIRSLEHGAPMRARG